MSHDGFAVLRIESWPPITEPGIAPAAMPASDRTYPTGDVVAQIRGTWHIHTWSLSSTDKARSPYLQLVDQDQTILAHVKNTSEGVNAALKASGRATGRNHRVSE